MVSNIEESGLTTEHGYAFSYVLDHLRFELESGTNSSDIFHPEKLIEVAKKLVEIKGDLVSSEMEFEVTKRGLWINSIQLS